MRGHGKGRATSDMLKQSALPDVVEAGAAGLLANAGFPALPLTQMIGKTLPGSPVRHGGSDRVVVRASAAREGVIAPEYFGQNNDCWRE